MVTRQQLYRYLQIFPLQKISLDQALGLEPHLP
jgi:hypothetical protein